MKSNDLESNGHAVSVQPPSRALIELDPRPPSWPAGLPGSLKSCLESLLGFFYPEVCQVCHEQRATKAQGYVCPECAKRARWIMPPQCAVCGLPAPGGVPDGYTCAWCSEERPAFLRARAAVFFADMVQEIVHRYKYRREVWFGAFLGDLLSRAAKPSVSGGGWDFIVPVPLHRNRLRERQFNQAEVLAGYLARATGVPLNARLLKRVEDTRSQTKLSRQEREANVRKAFALCAHTKLGGERIVVVDDVFTTGATTNACAQALQQGGAGDVLVWTLARAE